MSRTSHTVAGIRREEILALNAWAGSLVLIFMNVHPKDFIFSLPRGMSSLSRPTKIAQERTGHDTQRRLGYEVNDTKTHWRFEGMEKGHHISTDSEPSTRRRPFGMRGKSKS